MYKRTLVFSILFLILLGMTSSVSALGSITIKGLLGTNTMGSGAFTKSNFAGFGPGASDDMDISMASGLGLGVEVGLFDLPQYNVGIIGGLAYYLPRMVSNVSGTAKGSALGTQDYDLDLGSDSIQLSSIYLKAKYAFLKLEDENADVYISGKYSYDIPATSGSDISDLLRFENGTGYGFSIGAILGDKWDIEFCSDVIYLPARDILDFGSGLDDTLTGTVKITSSYLSIGYIL